MGPVGEVSHWPKTPRLNRDCIVTEKLDGTSMAIHIDDLGVAAVQSRNRLLSPDRFDHFGFHKWTADNQDTLVADLGVGVHHGEWWGSGIARGYGLTKGEKRFSLFNTSRFSPADLRTPGLHVVPVIDICPFDTTLITQSLDYLRKYGSFAAPGFMRPEGICVFHTAANQIFKVTLERDAEAKSQRQLRKVEPDWTASVLDADVLAVA